MKDFFISYNSADKAWAEWIAWILEESGYSVVIQVWDFRPGGNFALKMHEAARDTKKTIAILSENYLAAEYTQPEWAAAFAQDPRGQERALIPIRIEECSPEGLHKSIIYIDLVDLPEDRARQAILNGLKERAKPDEAPAFPAKDGVAESSSSARLITHPVSYPGISATDINSSMTPDIPWNIPTGIPFFTGRDEILTRINEALASSGAAALAQRQAISGLGGIGKTQTAIEYARRQRSQYKAVLWAVAETKESLISDFAAIANVLNLPERNIQDQSLTVRAVKRWLEANTDWLLILDNADEPATLEEFLPENSKGHILITSRAQVFDTIGILSPIELEEMSPDDARNFLLKRTGRQDPEPDEAQALDQLALELDYLPLALEQAGAYIKELRSSFQDYLASYRQRGLELLEKAPLSGKYRKSVRTTWSLNFQQVEQTSPAAADLLRFSAFVNPDRIPTELISQGAMHLGPSLSAALVNVDTDPLALDEVLKPLLQYSLVHRDRKSKTYDIHRLVQAVLKGGMDETARRLWADRTVKATASVFPDVDTTDLSQWDRIERLRPHAQACAELIKEYNLELLEGARMLNLTGRYFHVRGRLAEAAPLYERALAIRTKMLSAEHPEVASSLHNQAWLYFDQGRYPEAEQLYLHVLSLREAALGPEHIDTAKMLSQLGILYRERGKYSEAHQALTQALRIREKDLGAEHIDTAISLKHLAGLYISQSKFADAELLLNKSRAILEDVYGENHYEVANVLDKLGVVFFEQSKLAEAEALFLKCIAVYESIFGTNYPHLAGVIRNLALIYIYQGKFKEAESLLKRGLDINISGLGQEHPSTANSLSALAELYYEQRRYAEAETILKRALEISEKKLGAGHPDFGRNLRDLGRAYCALHKYRQAEPLTRQALSILRKSLGLENRAVASALQAHAAALRGTNRKGEAQRAEAQARKIQAKLYKKKSKKH